MEHSRSATIAAVKSYYEFLTKLYLKDSQVIWPPAEGWPSITNVDSAVIAPLAKSDEVLSLLAHLPYIHDDAEGAPGCVFADWQKLIGYLTRPEGPSTADDLRIITEGGVFAPLAPAHVVGLTSGGRETPIMVLDTKYGIVHWDNCPSSIEDAHYATAVDYETLDEEHGDNGDEDEDEDDDENDDDDDDDDGDEEPQDEQREQELEWRRDATAWSVPEFFEILKGQFIKLQWIPISHRAVVSADWSFAPNGEGLAAMLQNIYREHGWPDLANYRKEECLAAVRKAMEEHYPMHADPRASSE
ncbi:hypothetical protein OQA88_2545 [Cercophora sp. LCS_1]